jgi:hypothetical protein
VGIHGVEAFSVGQKGSVSVQAGILLSSHLFVLGFHAHTPEGVVLIPKKEEDQGSALVADLFWLIFWTGQCVPASVGAAGRERRARRTWAFAKVRRAAARPIKAGVSTWQSSDAQCALSDRRSAASGSRAAEFLTSFLGGPVFSVLLNFHCNMISDFSSELKRRFDCWTSLLSTCHTPWQWKIRNWNQGRAKNQRILISLSS